MVRLHPDKCDLGLELVSDKTKDIIQYYVYRVEKDFSDGSINWWELRMGQESYKAYPSLRGSRMIIYND